MHHLFSSQRLGSFPVRDHHAHAHRQSGCAQSNQAAAAGSVPAESLRNLAGMGHDHQSTACGCDGVISEAERRTFATRTESAAGRWQGRIEGTIKFSVLVLIRFYQAALSPLFPPACRHYPSCSAYAYEAMDTWGVWRGGRMALRRLLRCRPLGSFGYDPVPPQEK
jgi:uncharacterized protein